MSKFVKHFSNMFFDNATNCACSSCGASKSDASDFSVVNVADTAFSVSALLFFAAIILALLGLYNLLLAAFLILCNLCLLSKF